MSLSHSVEMKLDAKTKHNIKTPNTILTTHIGPTKSFFSYSHLLALS